MAKNSNGANLGFEAKLWEAADEIHEKDLEKTGNQ